MTAIPVGATHHTFRFSCRYSRDTGLFCPIDQVLAEVVRGASGFNTSDNVRGVDIGPSSALLRELLTSPELLSSRRFLRQAARIASAGFPSIHLFRAMKSPLVRRTMRYECVEWEGRLAVGSVTARVTAE